MFNRFVSILLLLLFVSCHSQDMEGELRTRVPFRTLAHGDSISSDFEITTYSEMVIDDEQEWSALLELISESTQLDFVITQTEVDFEVFAVIVVFDKTWLSGGHTIDITAVDRYEDQTVVTVERLGKGTINSVIQQPYHIVKINKVDLEVVFNRRF